MKKITYELLWATSSVSDGVGRDYLPLPTFFTQYWSSDHDDDYNDYHEYDDDDYNNYYEYDDDDYDNNYDDDLFNSGCTGAGALTKQWCTSAIALVQELEYSMIQYSIIL